MTALSKSPEFEGSLSEAPSRIDVVTFGCRLNTYESEVMRREAENAGLGALEGGAVIFNTCAVTGEAVRQARQAIRKARRDNPEARIAHEFPLDMEQVEVKQMVYATQNTGRPFPQVSE